MPKKSSTAPIRRHTRTINKCASDDLLSELPGKIQRIGIAADHGGFELKEFLAGKLRDAGFEILGGTPLFRLARHRQAADIFERLCAGGVLSNFVLVPMIWFIGSHLDTAVYPAHIPISLMSAVNFKTFADGIAITR